MYKGHIHGLCRTSRDDKVLLVDQATLDIDLNISTVVAGFVRNEFCHFFEVEPRKERFSPEFE